MALTSTELLRTIPPAKVVQVVSRRRRHETHTTTHNSESVGHRSGVVRTRSDGAINDRYPIRPIGPEHTVNLAIQQFSQRDESVSNRSIPVDPRTKASSSF